MIGPVGHAGRAIRRAPRLTLLLAALLAGAAPHAALAQDDATPTWWHEAAGLTPLLTAPPPPNPATICVIDTGVTPTPDLDITARWAYDGGTPDDVRATPESPGHGTLVAHFAAAAVNGWGGAGAFPHARISSVRVFPREGGASWQDYIRAITRCLKLDANTKVIVISIGGQEIDEGEADELEHWIVRARDRGVNVVVSAGNGGSRPDFPARFSAAFTVSAAAQDGQLCEFSARGDAVDIAAPGCMLPQAGWDGGLWSASGTSYAAPIVAGTLAALRSYAPTLSPRDAEAIVSGSARGVPPLLDAAAALRAAGMTGLGEINASRSPTPRASSLAEPGSAAPPEPEIRGRDRRWLSPPRIHARKLSRGVQLTARNRPRGASLEVRVRHTRTRRRSSRVRVRTLAHSARCRFVTELATSGWTRVYW